jgi:hypothetical protein
MGAFGAALRTPLRPKAAAFHPHQTLKSPSLEPTAHIREASCFADLDAASPMAAAAAAAGGSADVDAAVGAGGGQQHTPRRTPASSATRSRSALPTPKAKAASAAQRGASAATVVAGGKAATPVRARVTRRARRVTPRESWVR